MSEIMNPATGESMGALVEASSGQVEKAFRAAKEVQPAWAQRKLSERIECMVKFKETLKSDVAELSRVLSNEMGKPIAQAKNEILGTLKRIDYFVKEVEGVLRPRKLSEAEELRFEPLGVVVNISAWNYPYFVGSNVFVPALLTGNVVLYKPSEYATHTGLAIDERLKASGIPNGVFQTLTGKGPTAQALLKLPIDGVFFTGSHATGVRIAEQVRSKMIKLQMELGGKDPIYVCEDVEAKKVAPGIADGAFYNTGQSCCSVERIYVHEKIFHSFVEAFVETVKGFKSGDPLKEDTYIGPLTRKEQLEVLEEQVKDAKAKGARCLVGGKRTGSKGNYFEPTVLVDVNASMSVMRDESFGPIIGIQKVSGDAEAVKLMNDTAYGLTAGVYTRDRTRAEKILAQIQSGSVYWNCCDRVTPALPWSGRKGSGIGATLGHMGIQAFVHPKAWHFHKN